MWGWLFKRLGIGAGLGDLYSSSRPPSTPVAPAIPDSAENETEILSLLNNIADKVFKIETGKELGDITISYVGGTSYLVLDKRPQAASAHLTRFFEALLVDPLDPSSVRKRETEGSYYINTTKQFSSGAVLQKLRELNSKLTELNPESLAHFREIVWFAKEIEEAIPSTSGGAKIKPILELVDGTPTLKIKVEKSGHAFIAPMEKKKGEGIKIEPKANSTPLVTFGTTAALNFLLTEFRANRLGKSTEATPAKPQNPMSI